MRARCGGGATAWVAGVLAAPGTQGSWQLGQQEIQCSRGYGNQYWPIYSSILAWRTPSQTEKPGRPPSTGSQRVGHNRSDPARIGARLFLPVATLPHGQLSVKVGLPCRDPGGPKCAGTWTASATGVMALSEAFLQPPVAGAQKALLASLSPKLCPFRHLESFLAWGPLLFCSLGP